MARQPNQGRADLKLGREELEHWSNISGKSTPRCEVKVVKVDQSRRVSMAFPVFPSQAGHPRSNTSRSSLPLGGGWKSMGNRLTWHFKHIEDPTNMGGHGRGQMGTFPWAPGVWRIQRCQFRWAHPWSFSDFPAMARCYSFPVIAVSCPVYRSHINHSRSKSCEGNLSPSDGFWHKQTWFQQIWVCLTIHKPIWSDSWQWTIFLTGWWLKPPTRNCQNLFSMIFLPLVN